MADGKSNKRKRRRQQLPNLIAVKRWALRDWNSECGISIEGSRIPSNSQDEPPKTVFSIKNNAPTWELVLAKVVSTTNVNPVSVLPLSAMMAPKGGCDNLCNDLERYTDTSEFIVTGHGILVLVRTEECQWKCLVT
jgi:hypothetical protein